MQTTLTGHMDSKMVEDVTTALERFSGQEIKVTIELFSGRKSKVGTSNARHEKNALVHDADLNGEDDR